MAATRAFDADLRSLIEQEGPFLSVYLNTEAAREDAVHEIDLRWRAQRDAALEAGATEAIVDAVDALVKDAHLKGDGVVAFGAGDGIALRRSLPSPIEDQGSFGPLPLLVPYLEWQQDNPRYALVLTDRVGGEIHVVGGFGDEKTVSVESDQEPISKVNPGGWSQRRYQQRAENSWEANAKEIARELDRIVAGEPIDFVVIAGDVRAVTFLQEHISHEIQSVACEVKAEPYSIEEIADQLQATVASYTGQTMKEILDRFEEERGQDDLATEGVDATLNALRQAQVDTLLVTRDGVGRPAWFAVSDVTQAATDKGPLTDLGIGDVAEADATDVAIRAALGTGARIVVVPSGAGRQAPKEGVGALLRYA